MNSIPRPNLYPNRWLLDSALAPHIDAYVAHLNRGRYSSSSTSRYLAGIAHFARWMKLSRLALSKIDEIAIIKFLDEHLPHCNCPKPVVRGRRDLHAACVHLLVVLRNSGAIPLPALASVTNSACQCDPGHPENLGTRLAAIPSGAYQVSACGRKAPLVRSVPSVFSAGAKVLTKSTVSSFYLIVSIIFIIAKLKFENYNLLSL